MNVWLVALHSFMIGAMLILMTLGLGVAVTVPGIDRWNKRFFTFLFASLLLAVTFYAADSVSEGNAELLPMAEVFSYFESLLVALPMFLFSVLLLHCCGESWRSSAYSRAVPALGALYFALLNLAQLSPLIYYYSPDNRFWRGPWYPLLMAPLFVVMLLNMVGVIRRRERLSRRYCRAFLFYLVSLTFAVITDLFSFFLVEVGITLSTLSMFVVILADQFERYILQQREIVRQQREIAHQRASIMVLQMRPHFIFNTMTSIYCLCRQDPEKARQVTMDFTTYLRKNFTAIASEDAIPFSEELAHTRAYLAVEQANLEGSLFVEYDTPHTHFRMPPLTLQPLVENAVKHGFDPYSAPLTISVRTRETDCGTEITVEDSGSGFASDDDGAPHIALTNIRQRLELICGGKLTLTPREGGGTVATMTIPAEKPPDGREKRRFFDGLFQ